MLDFFYDIVLSGIDILTLVFGLSGFVLAVLLLFRPGALQKAGCWLNANITPARAAAIFNHPVETERLVYRFPRTFGALLTGASLVVLVFFFHGPDFTAVNDLLLEVLLEALLWTFKIASFCGMLLGTMLFLAPERVKRIERLLNTWMETEKILNYLERNHMAVDNFFLRHPLPSGAVVLLASFVLIILSVAHLYK